MTGDPPCVNVRITDHGLRTTVQQRRSALVKAAGNPDLGPVVRLFLSVNPPPEVIARLVTEQSSLRSRLFDRFGDELAVRWTKPSQFHITLIFLGNQFLHQTDRIRDEIKTTIAASQT